MLTLSLTDTNLLDLFFGWQLSGLLNGLSFVEWEGAKVFLFHKSLLTVLRQISRSCGQTTESHLGQILMIKVIIFYSHLLVIIQLKMYFSLPWKHNNLSTAAQVSGFRDLRKGGQCWLLNSFQLPLTLLAQGWIWGSWSTLGYILDSPFSRPSSASVLSELTVSALGCCKSPCTGAKRLHLHLFQTHPAPATIKTPPRFFPWPFLTPHQWFLVYTLCCAIIIILKISFKEEKSSYHNQTFKKNIQLVIITR